MDHSPRPNDKKMQNEQLSSGKEIFAKKVVFWGPGLAGDPLENQENAKDFQCWPSSVELGRARPAVKILNIRARPASAELGRGEPSSAQLGRAQPRMPTEPGPKKCDFPRSRWPKNEFLYFYDLELARYDSA